VYNQRFFPQINTDFSIDLFSKGPINMDKIIFNLLHDTKVIKSERKKGLIPFILNYPSTTIY